MILKNIIGFPVFQVESMLRNLDFVNYLIAGIIILAMLLAIFNEDASTGSVRLAWVLGEFLPVQHSNFTINSKLENGYFKKKDNKFYSALEFIYGLWIELKESIHEGKLCTLLNEWKTKVMNKINLYRNLIVLKYKAHSKRHLFYLLVKKQYNLPIAKDEREMQTYLDAKRKLIQSDRWSFMWCVSDVKKEYIICENKQVRSISSYSYLDFIREPKVQDAAIQAAKEWSTGSHGPRMLGGNAKILRDLEKVVGRFFGRNDSILGVCGFLACMSGIAAVTDKDVLVILDNKNHACIKAGLKITGAKQYMFRHNNYEHLEALLIKHRKKYRTCWVCIESVYSMDGDIAHLPTVKKLCVKYDAKLMIDEAHGLGVLGKTGRGLEEHFNMMGAADMIVGTFSKSLGGVGGYIVASDDMIEYLDFHSISNVFSAPLPAYCAGGVMKAFELIDSEPWRLEKLKFNSKYLRDALKSGMGHWPKDYPESHKFVVQGDDATSVIMLIFYNDPDRMFKICNALLNAGWMVSGVAYPACPMKSPRFRITATCAYSIELMNSFVRDIVRVTVSIPPSPFEDSLMNF